MEILKTTVADINGPESELAGVEAEINMLAEKVQALIDENARVAQNQIEYEGRYKELMGRYEERNERLSALTEQIEKAKAADKIIGHFVDLLRDMNETVTEFDENLWGGNGREHNHPLKGKYYCNLQRRI